MTDTAAFMGIRGNLIGTNAAGTAGSPRTSSPTACAWTWPRASSSAARRRRAQRHLGRRPLCRHRDERRCLGLDRRQLHRNRRHRHVSSSGTPSASTCFDASPLIRGNVIAGQGTSASGSSTRAPRSWATSSARTSRRRWSSATPAAASTSSRRTATSRSEAPRRARATSSPTTGGRLISFIGGVHVRNAQDDDPRQPHLRQPVPRHRPLGGRAGGVGDAQRPRRPRRRTEREPELPDHHRTSSRVREHDDLRIPRQHAVDDLRHRLLRRSRRAASSPTGFLQGERYIGSTDPDDGRVGPGRLSDDRSLPARSRRVDDRDGDRSAGRHVGVLAAPRPLDRSALGPGRGRHADRIEGMEFAPTLGHGRRDSR